MSKRGDSYHHYTCVTYGGKQLVKRHELHEVGTWHIKGEDPNCDFGGAHHQPDLGYFTGDLDSCIKYAIALKGFWTWGGGGSINLVKASTDAIKVADFTKIGAALAKLTQEEIELLGLQDKV